MQSGISASQELHAAFKTLLTSPDQRGLLATIEKEQLVPRETIQSTSSSFHSDLSNLKPHLQPNAALYILFKTTDDPSSTPPRLAAITYVPNAAPVRQKMLFASTRLTLARELGTEHFAESLFTTEADELTAEGWRRHEKHTELDQPLTQEEKELGAIKRAEAEEGRGSQQRKGHVSSSGVNLNVEDGVREALESLKGAEDGTLVQLEVDIPTETLRNVSTSLSITPSKLSSTISASAPRYSFYTYTPPSSPSPVIVFIYTCPSSTPVKDRMVYALARNNVVEVVGKKDVGLVVEKKIEETEASDVTAETVESEFKGHEETKSAFARPKRPGRR